MNFSKIIMLFAVISLAACNNAPKGDKADVNEAAPVEETQNADRTLSVDPATSLVNWKGSKIGKEHNGTVRVSSGSLLIKEGKVAGGEFVIDMTTITDNDLTGEGKAKLEGHLKSPDFFDVEKYPTAKYVVTKITELKGDDQATHLAYGNLTLKDVTKEVGFKVNIDVTSDDAVVISSPEFTLNRADFNVKYGSNTFFDNLKDQAINDMIGLTVVVTAK